MRVGNMGKQHMHMPRLSAESGAVVGATWQQDSAARQQGSSERGVDWSRNFREGKGESEITAIGRVIR